ncbi:MAG: ABC transporter ATP-binding protein [Clostridia bacterium]|nr:ABC transporter ATP-binding protein [Clostridia bacterium]
MEDIICVKNVGKSFGTKKNPVEVLKDININIKKGEFVSLMGQSGSGKSTLLYLIGGLDNPTNGTIEIAGKDISKMKDKAKSKMRRQDIGFVFQFYNLVPNLTVEENILLPVVMDGKSKGKYKKELDEILKIVGLENKRKCLPRELSGGQQQRVSIARAVIMNPSIILADEATGNLDSKSGKDVMELFSKINKEKNITILQVTHSQEIADYGNRTIHLKDGRIVE